MSELTRTALAIEKDLLGRFDKWMTGHGYSNRSEALRDLIRSALVEAEWEKPASKVIATLSIIYDHEQRELHGNSLPSSTPTITPYFAANMYTWTDTNAWR